jgi:general secretion pathway protein J
MKAGGFTLLEVLIALAVFGFLLVGLSQTVRFGLTAWQQDTRLSDGKTDLEAVDRTLRAVIENLAPADDAGQTSIEGTAETMTGITKLRLPGSGLLPIPADAGLAVNRGRLVLRWRPYHHGVPLKTLPPPRETELIGGVTHLGLAYWRPPGVWVSRWREPDLPALIRLHLTFAGPAPARWPDIIVAPLLSRP